MNLSETVRHLVERVDELTRKEQLHRQRIEELQYKVGELENKESGEQETYDINTASIVDIDASSIKATVWTPNLTDEVTEIKINENGIYLNGSKIEFSGETQERLTDKPEYDQDEAIEFIFEKLFPGDNFKKQAKNEIRKILDADEEYKRTQGIIED